MLHQKNLLTSFFMVFKQHCHSVAVSSESQYTVFCRRFFKRCIHPHSVTRIVPPNSQMSSNISKYFQFVEFTRLGLVQFSNWEYCFVLPGKQSRLGHKAITKNAPQTKQSSKMWQNPRLWLPNKNRALVDASENCHAEAVKRCDPMRDEFETKKTQSERHATAKNLVTKGLAMTNLFLLNLFQMGSWIWTRPSSPRTFGQHGGAPQAGHQG